MPPEQPPTQQRPQLKLLIELGPLVAFFITQRTAGLYWATGVLMLALVLSLAASWRLEGKLPTMPLITAGFVLVMGGLTLGLHDDTFIKLKPTLVNSVFALILLGGMACGRLFLKSVFAEAFELEEAGWRKLTLRLGVFFIGLAILNEIVWRNFSEDNWVTFKVFGIMPLTLLFMVAQAPLLKRHGVTPEKTEQ
jgi:intracellular septation protein